MKTSRAPHYLPQHPLWHPSSPPPPPTPPCAWVCTGPSTDTPGTRTNSLPFFLGFRCLLCQREASLASAFNISLLNSRSFPNNLSKLQDLIPWPPKRQSQHQGFLCVLHCDFKGCVPQSYKPTFPKANVLGNIQHHALNTTQLPRASTVLDGEDHPQIVFIHLSWKLH